MQIQCVPPLFDYIQLVLPIYFSQECCLFQGTWEAMQGINQASVGMTPIAKDPTVAAEVTSCKGAGYRIPTEAI